MRTRNGFAGPERGRECPEGDTVYIAPAQK